MTDKRFIIPDGYDDTDVTLIDTHTGVEYEDNFEDIVILLNWLQDDFSLCRKRNLELVKENEELKKELQKYKNRDR